MDDKRAIGTIRKVMPAVVSIAIAKKLDDLKREAPKDLPPPPDSIADERGMVQVGGGSGFIIDERGLVLTNKHVVSDANAEYTVILNDERRFPAEILTRDPINDVAILQVRGAGKLPTLKLGDAARLELGESVIAIGNALGVFRNTVSIGIVSGLSRSIAAQADPDAPPQEMRGLIQTDAAINPGNSGGPLVDRDGFVVGVNAAIVTGAQSIGFAIPVNAARRDLHDLKKYGRIRRPLLGLRYVMVDDTLKSKMNLAVNYGALVTREAEHDYAVVPDSPAAKAGLREKDIVLTIGAERLDRNHPIQDFLENLNVDDEIELGVLRDGKEFKTKVLLAERK
ncbi:MAG TPA: trypsin-like peptidase domain-containing protein [Candidatus Paceibacterota bacterium]|nr:trypsin-like peptidase domain-containing protein [Candidatus Paceibacterota bacterium]